MNNTNIEYIDALKSYETLTALISSKQEELKKLDTELDDLRNYINETFMEEFKDYDYKVDITNCYIIELDGKKYITLRNRKIKVPDDRTVATACLTLNTYYYFDVLNIENKKFKHIHTYLRLHDESGYFEDEYDGKPKYQKHILKVYPELANFQDNMVPNTYLKKIYYEINDLSNKKIKQKTD